MEYLLTIGSKPSNIVENKYFIKQCIHGNHENTALENSSLKSPVSDSDTNSQKVGHPISDLETKLTPNIEQVLNNS